MSGALDALRAAMASGDVEGLARSYARNAVLQASLPGGRVRRDGRPAIVAELAAWWKGPGEVDEWRAGEWPAGAALTAARDGVRRRHYLHLSGDLIARHWVYAMAGRPSRRRRPPGSEASRTALRAYAGASASTSPVAIAARSASSAPLTAAPGP